jgi:hypothetical protein
LRQIFLPIIAIEGPRHRILVIDGHDSHISGEFLVLCQDADIHLVFLPPHSSHILQPLDQGPFKPLKDAYRNAARKFSPTDLQIIGRAEFVILYNQIRPDAFSEARIKSGWRRTRLEPVNMQAVVNSSRIFHPDRTTPELEVPSQQQSLDMTPIKAPEFRAHWETIERNSSPSTKRVVRRLGRVIQQQFAAKNLFEFQLKTQRLTNNKELVKARQKRLNMTKNERSLNAARFREERAAAEASEARPEHLLVADQLQLDLNSTLGL